MFDEQILKLVAYFVKCIIPFIFIVEVFPAGRLAGSYVTTISDTGAVRWPDHVRKLLLRMERDNPSGPAFSRHFAFGFDSPKAFL